MAARQRNRQLRYRWALLIAVLAAAAVTFYASSRTSPQGRLTFTGYLARGITPWTKTGGGAQCANYGTPSTAPRVRGSFFVAHNAGLQAGRFDLPASQLPSFPLQACELLTVQPLGLGTDEYYGYMFYVPPGWTTGTSSFWGITTAQFHFQNIWGSPVEFELHNDHMTLALQTGACHNLNTPAPGCRWNSNADSRDGHPGNLGAQYVVPPPMQKGVWHEVVMHVHWASDSSGQIQVWHRVKDASDWKETVNVGGHPTVQWNVARGCCYPTAVDKIGAYRGASSVPVSLWEGNLLIGTTFNAVAQHLP